MTRQYRKFFKHRKSLLLRIIHSLSFKLDKLADNKIAMAIKQLIRKRLPSKLAKTRMSAGFQHQRLIREVKRLIKQITEIVIKAQTKALSQSVAGQQKSVDITSEIYQSILDIVVPTEKGKRLEPNAVHVIVEGSAEVINKKSLMTLAKGKHFGLCNLTHQVGPEFYGEIRAGLSPLLTYSFDYEVLKKRLSAFERAALEDIVDSSGAQSKQVKALAKKYGIYEDELFNF